VQRQQSLALGLKAVATGLYRRPANQWQRNRAARLKAVSVFSFEQGLCRLLWSAFYAASLSDSGWTASRADLAAIFVCHRG